jgi:acyl-CoA-binding protein
VPNKADRPGFTNFTGRYKWDSWEKHWLALAKELKLKHDNEGLTEAEKEERRVTLSKKAKQLYVEKLIAVSTTKP